MLRSSLWSKAIKTTTEINSCRGGEFQHYKENTQHLIQQKCMPFKWPSEHLPAVTDRHVHEQPHTCTCVCKRTQSQMPCLHQRAASKQHRAGAGMQITKSDCPSPKPTDPQRPEEPKADTLSSKVKTNTDNINYFWHRIILWSCNDSSNKLKYKTWQIRRTEAGVEVWYYGVGGHQRKINPPGGGDESFSRFALRLEIFWLRPSCRNLNLL